MGRSRDINAEKVAEAASRLMREGRVPTPLLVKNEIGGSFPVVKELMDAWEKTHPATAELERIAPRVLSTLVSEIYRISALAEQKNAKLLSISQENYIALHEEHKGVLADHAAAEERQVSMASERDGALALAQDRGLEHQRLRTELEFERTEKSASDVAHAEALERGLAAESKIRDLEAALKLKTAEHLQVQMRLHQEEMTNAGLLGRQTQLEVRMVDLQSDKDALTRENEVARQAALQGKVQIAELRKELVVTTKILNSFAGGKLRGIKAKLVQGELPKMLRPKRLPLKLTTRRVKLFRRSKQVL